MNINKIILLVEDNAQDEKLILRALRKVNLANQVDVVRDGQQALDYLFQRGSLPIAPATAIRPLSCSISACRASAAWRS
jgi:hypothetical protein